MAGHVLALSDTALHQVAATLGDTFNIAHEQEANIHLKAAPWQEIRPQVEQFAKRPRLRQSNVRRAFLDHVPEIDRGLANPTRSAHLRTGIS